jgi:hypothetical protein
MLHYLHLQGDLPGQPMSPKPSPAKNACANSIKIVASHVRSKADKAAAFCGKDITSKSGITFVTALPRLPVTCAIGQAFVHKAFWVASQSH